MCQWGTSLHSKVSELSMDELRMINAPNNKAPFFPESLSPISIASASERWCSDLHLTWIRLITCTNNGWNQGYYDGNHPFILGTDMRETLCWTEAKYRPFDPSTIHKKESWVMPLRRLESIRLMSVSNFQINEFYGTVRNSSKDKIVHTCTRNFWWWYYWLGFPVVSVNISVSMTRKPVHTVAQSAVRNACYQQYIR